MTDDSEPTTAAGRRFLRQVFDIEDRRDAIATDQWFRDHVARIEAEARQPDSEALDDPLAKGRQLLALRAEYTRQPDSEALRAALDWALDNLDAEDEVIGDAMSWAITVRGQTTTMARSTEYESGKQKARAALQASNHPIEPSRAPNCPDCGMPISRHAKGCTNARAPAPAPQPEPLRAALEALTEWAEGSEGEGCHWCLFSEGHEGGCPVGDARAALQASESEATPQPDNPYAKASREARAAAAEGTDAVER